MWCGPWWKSGGGGNGGLGRDRLLEKEGRRKPTGVRSHYYEERSPVARLCEEVGNLFSACSLPLPLLCYSFGGSTARSKQERKQASKSLARKLNRAGRCC